MGINDLIAAAQVNVRIAELRRELIPRLEAALLAPVADDRRYAHNKRTNSAIRSDIIF